MLLFVSSLARSSVAQIALAASLALLVSCSAVPESLGVPSGAWIARGTIDRSAGESSLESSIEPAVAARDFERATGALSREADEVLVIEIDDSSWREEWRIGGALPFTETKSLRVVASAETHWLVELTDDEGRSERVLLVRTSSGLLYRTRDTTAALQRIPR